MTLYFICYHLLLQQLEDEETALEYAESFPKGVVFTMEVAV